MIVGLPDNTETDAHFSTEPAASSHGIPVLVIDGEPHGPADVAGMRIVKASADEIDTIRRFGFLMA